MAKPQNIEQVEAAIEQCYTDMLKDIPPAVMAVIGADENGRLRSMFSAGFYCGCNYLYDCAKQESTDALPTP